VHKEMLRKWGGFSCRFVWSLQTLKKGNGLVFWDFSQLFHLISLCSKNLKCIKSSEMRSAHSIHCIFGCPWGAWNLLWPEWWLYFIEGG